MATERTFVMLKPDCVKRRLIGQVIARIENKGYRIVNMEMRKLTSEFLYQFYAHITDKPFFLQVFEYMLAGPVLGIVVEGEGAVQGMRRMIGATEIENAQPGTIRGDFAQQTANNIIHASGSIDSAVTESDIFFKLDADPEARLR